jgi:hypothetical protein
VLGDALTAIAHKNDEIYPELFAARVEPKSQNLTATGQWHERGTRGAWMPFAISEWT